MKLNASIVIYGLKVPGGDFVNFEKTSTLVGMLHVLLRRCCLSSNVQTSNLSGR